MTEKREQSVVDPQTGKTTTFQVFSIKDKVVRKRTADSGKPTKGEPTNTKSGKVDE